MSYYCLIVELSPCQLTWRHPRQESVSALEGRIADYGADQQDVMQTTAVPEEN